MNNKIVIIGVIPKVIKASVAFAKINKVASYQAILFIGLSEVGILPFGQNQGKTKANKMISPI
jgi:hypothetical protein